MKPIIRILLLTYIFLPTLSAHAAKPSIEERLRAHIQTFLSAFKDKKKMTLSMDSPDRTLDALKHLPHLKFDKMERFTLHGADMSKPATLACVEILLKKMPQVTNINLSQSNMTDAALAKLLPHLPKLVSLNLSENHLTHKGMSHLAPRMTQLQVLDISDNPIGDAGVDVIVKHAPHLNHLSVWKTGITDKGGRSILARSQKKPHFKYLNLRQNPKLTDPIKYALQEHFKKANGNLKEFWVD